MTTLSRKAFFCLSILLLCSVATGVSAQIAIESPIGAESFKELIGSITKALGDLIVALGAVMIIISGVLFMISMGDEGKISTAKNALFWACTGILVGLVAGAIGDTIREAATGGDLTAVIKNITKIMSGLLAGLGSVMAAIAGIIWMFSLGDQGRVATAKKTLLYAFIGIGIGIAAEAIVDFVISLT